VDIVAQNLENVNLENFTLDMAYDIKMKRNCDGSDGPVN